MERSGGWVQRAYTAFGREPLDKESKSDLAWATDSDLAWATDSDLGWANDSGLAWATDLNAQQVVRAVEERTEGRGVRGEENKQ